MYLEIFLADFAVFRVSLGISRDFAEMPEFHGSATARNIRSPVQISVTLFFVELRLPATYFLFFSVFLLLYMPKSVDMTINLSIILQTTQIQKQFLLSVFVFIDSLVVSALQDVGGYAISCQNNLELHLGCHTF